MDPASWQTKRVSRFGHWLILTLSPPLNETKIGSLGGLQFLENGDEGIAVLYKPFYLEFYGKHNGEIRNVLASIVFNKSYLIKTKGPPRNCIVFF
jgi:hypothetical protein